MMLMAAVDWFSFFFIVFALIACIFAAAVLFTSNVVRMAFFLTLSLGATAGLFFLAGAPFVGAMQLMIYVGGTLVLLIFGVMLTAQARFISMRTRSGEWIAAVVTGSALLILLLSAALSVDSWRDQGDGGTPIVSEAQSATALGAGLSGVRIDKLNVKDPRGMSGYLLPFVIVSVHLLVVLIGAAYMARSQGIPADIPPPSIRQTTKRRPLALLLLIAAMLLADFLAVTAVLFQLTELHSPFFALVHGSDGLIAVAWLLAFAQGVSLLALLSWRRWGFYGVCVTAVFSAIPVCLEIGIEAGIIKAVIQAGLVGALYALLRWGDTASVWTELEP